MLDHFLAFFFVSMKIEYDNHRFRSILEGYFQKSIEHNVCAINETGKILGGCGFSEVFNKESYAFILKVRQNWASKELYSEILKYPFLILGAEKVYAIVRDNIASENICKHLNGSNIANYKFLFEKETALATAKRILKDE